MPGAEGGGFSYADLAGGPHTASCGIKHLCPVQTKTIVIQSDNSIYYEEYQPTPFLKPCSDLSDDNICDPE